MQPTAVDHPAAKTCVDRYRIWPDLSRAASLPSRCALGLLPGFAGTLCHRLSSQVQTALNLSDHWRLTASSTLFHYPSGFRLIRNGLSFTGRCKNCMELCVLCSPYILYLFACLLTGLISSSVCFLGTVFGLRLWSVRLSLVPSHLFRHLYTVFRGRWYRFAVSVTLCPFLRYSSTR